MDYNKFKNLDKQIAGVKCYDVLKYVWGTIKEECGNSLLVENEDGTTYFADRENIYPIAENLRLDRDREELICYEISNDIDSPYYCPEYDEDEDDFEVVDITKTFKGKALESIDNNKSIEESTSIMANNASNENIININVGKKNARLMVDMLIATLEQLYREDYAKTYDIDEEAVPNIYFVRNYIDRIFDKYKDNPEIGVKEVYRPLETLTLYDYLTEIFTEEVLHTCQRTLIGEDNMKSMTSDVLETYIDKVNSLEDSELLDIYNQDNEIISGIRVRLGIDKCFKAYKVKCEVVQKYIVEVKAASWDEAKRKALADMNKTDKPNNCRLINSTSKVKNW